MLPGPSERTLSINEEELEGGFRNWNAANKGPEDLFKSEVLFPLMMWGFGRSWELALNLGRI